MQRDYNLYLKDILQAIDKINRYISRLSLHDFMNDDKKTDAVIHNLQIIGEAVRNIPPRIRFNYPDVEWEKIGGLRNIIVHEYFALQIKRIWEILMNKLPILEEQIKHILSS